MPIKLPTLSNPWLGGISLALLLTGCGGQNVKPIASADLDRLTQCDVAPSQARKNLINAGYTIQASDDDGFSTDFKMADAETVEYLLGATSDEYLRQYRIDSSGDGSGIRISVNYRHISYPHPGDNGEGKQIEISTGPRNWQADQLAVLEQINAEVCGSAVAVAQPAAATPVMAQPTATGAVAQPQPAVTNSTLDYLLEKCREGDQVACDLLRP